MIREWIQSSQWNLNLSRKQSLLDLNKTLGVLQLISDVFIQIIFQIILPASYLLKSQFGFSNTNLKFVDIILAEPPVFELFWVQEQ
jgi:hypothetical protein